MKLKFKKGDIVIQINDLDYDETPFAKIINIEKNRYENEGENGIEHIHQNKKYMYFAEESCFRKPTKKEMKEYMVDQL